MARASLTPDMLALIAERLRALAEPARLTILHQLRDGERTVTQLVEATGLGQANLSKHLQILHGAGFVRRRKEGMYCYYGLADRDVFRICELMCDRLGAEAELRRKVVGRR